MSTNLFDEWKHFFLEKGSLDQNLNLRTEAELNNRFYFIFLDLSFDFGESDHGVRAGEGGAGPRADEECRRPQGQRPISAPSRQLAGVRVPGGRACSRARTERASKERRGTCCRLRGARGLGSGFRCRRGARLLN